MPLPPPPAEAFIALDRFEFEGLSHNVDFLSALMQHPRFREGRLTTGFIANEYSDGFVGTPASPDLMARLAATAAVVAQRQGERAARISGQLDGAPAADRCWVVRARGGEQHVALGENSAIVDGKKMAITAPYTPGQRLVEAVIEGEPLSVRIDRSRAGRLRLTARGAVHDLQALPPSVAELAHHMVEKEPPDLSRFLICPMTGLLFRYGRGNEDGKHFARAEAGHNRLDILQSKRQPHNRCGPAGTELNC